MILVAGGIKGGSGKTTVATNLAIMLSKAGRDVLLVDADDQETATDFTTLRNEVLPEGAGYTTTRLTGQAVRTETKRFSEKYQDIVIDTGGRDTASQRAALTVADILLVPFVPRSFDVWTLERVSALVEEMRQVNPNLKAVTFINRADPSGRDNDDAAEAMRETENLDYLNTQLGSRKAFANAASRGLSVIELKPVDTKATAEIEILFRYVCDIMKISEKHL